MRETVLYTLLSLDGVAEEPGDWLLDVDVEVFENLAAVVATQQDVLLGRRTYDEWAGYWPGSDVQPFADFINGTPKHVVTSTPPEIAWSRSVVVDEPVGPYLERLRAGEGGDIGVHGSITLAQHLLAADLVDRLELVVVPTVAGAGRRLFRDGDAFRRLQLDRVVRTSSGSVCLGYRRRPEA